MCIYAERSRCSTDRRVYARTTVVMTNLFSSFYLGDLSYTVDPIT